jgi:tRNA G37 N-methylase Trm5
MVRRAIALLDPQPGERIGDLFCGLGNFTLPIARRGAHAVGVEASAGLIARARANAAANALAGKTEFHAADLFEIGPADFALLAEALGCMTEQMAYVHIGLPAATPRPERIRQLGEIVGEVWYRSLPPVG